MGIPDGLVRGVSAVPPGAWKREQQQLGYDATTEHYYPEGPDSGVGYLYLLGLNDGWIKVGQTTEWWGERRTTLRRQIPARHRGLRVEREWKTPSLPAEVLDWNEGRVKSYARQLSDGSQLTYDRGDGHLSLETEMFHGADYDQIRAYIDVIGRCEALW